MTGAGRAEKYNAPAMTTAWTPMARPAPRPIWRGGRLRSSTDSNMSHLGIDKTERAGAIAEGEIAAGPKCSSRALNVLDERHSLFNMAYGTKRATRSASRRKFNSLRGGLARTCGAKPDGAGAEWRRQFEPGLQTTAWNVPAKSTSCGVVTPLSRRWIRPVTHSSLTL